MKRINKFLIATVLISCSSIISSIGCTLGFDNSSQNNLIYLNNLLKNPYESLIFKSSGSVEDETYLEEYNKKGESRIGLYSEKKDCNIESLKFEANLIKASYYDDDRQYNSFGVLSSIVGGKQYSWNELNGNNCFISRELSLRYESISGYKESSLIGKTILFGSSKLTIAGIYYTNSSSFDVNETKTKGNVFSLTFNDAIFVSEDFESETIEFKSFLFLTKQSKVKANEIYEDFIRAVKANNQTIYSPELVGNYTMENNIVEKIESISLFYSTSNKVLCGFILLFSFGLFVFSLIFLNRYEFKLLSNRFIKNSTPLLFVLIMAIQLLVLRFTNLKTSLGVSITFNNPAAVSVVSSMFFLITVVVIIKITKEHLKQEISLYYSKNKSQPNLERDYDTIEI